jgi:RHS repeat-associated protein
VFGTRAKVGTRTFLRAGVGVTAGVLADGNADYTPGISEVRSGTTTYSHSGLKHLAAQSCSGASVSATREYDAFGGVASSSGSWQGPFGAAGAFGYQTEASGLHLLGHRYYDSSVGRFSTRDPIGDGSNWYAYCENDPVSQADPEGEVPFRVWLMLLLRTIQFYTDDGDLSGRIPNPKPGSPPPPGLERPLDPPRPPRPPRFRLPGGRGGASGGGIGAVATGVIGADALRQGLGIVIPYRRRLQAHVLDTYDGGTRGDAWEGAGG